MIKLLSLVFILSLIGCTVPVTVASVGVWGATGKSPTDHTLSYATDSDCKTYRIVLNDKVCQNGIDRQEQVFAQRQRQ